MIRRSNGGRAVRIGACVMVAGMALAGGCRQPAVFSSDVTTDAKPWTHLNFRNDPDAFQFAIVSDRTGGHRDGVFESAVEKLNLLQPEFVITVGDAIEGYTEDETVLEAQWAEYMGFVHRLEMPFFFVPGNHDNVNPVMREHYSKRFGRHYYSFVYRDVLFLTLDSQEGSPGLGADQVAWAVETLRAHADVRWTLVFMHQPLWLHEEGDVTTARKQIGAARPTGFGEIMAQLDGRPHTVFAGHFHEYVQYERLGEQYFVLSTTGGGSALRGPAFGEFDHAVWITMTPKGPRIANLLLDGILPADVRTEQHARFRQDLKVRVDAEDGEPAAGVPVELVVPNPFKHRLHADLQWSLPADSGWRLEPSSGHAHVPSGTTNTFAFRAFYTGDALPTVVPVALLHATAGHDLPPTAEPIRLSMPVAYMLAARRPITVASAMTMPPVLDGLADEEGWQAAGLARDFRFPDLRVPLESTEVRVAHDADALYIAFDCRQSAMESLRTNITERDGNLWADDAVELMVGRTDTDASYVHVVVNAAGVLYDAVGQDRAALNGGTRVGTARQEDGWSVEVAIPWADLGGAPAPGQDLSFQLVRTRPERREAYQYPPLDGSNHRRELHGVLKLAP